MSNLRVYVFRVVSLIHVYLLSLIHLHIVEFTDVFGYISITFFYSVLRSTLFFPITSFLPSLQPPAELVGYSLFPFIIPSSGLKIIHSISVL